VVLAKLGSRSGSSQEVREGGKPNRCTTGGGGKLDSERLTPGDLLQRIVPRKISRWFDHTKERNAKGRRIVSGLSPNRKWGCFIRDKDHQGVSSEIKGGT